jgi:hypothetical protein
MMFWYSADESWDLETKRQEMEQTEEANPRLEEKDVQDIPLRCADTKNGGRIVMKKWIKNWYIKDNKVQRQKMNKEYRINVKQSCPLDNKLTSTPQRCMENGGIGTILDLGTRWR